MEGRDRRAPVLAAALVAAIWLAVHPNTVDMAAHLFRARLFGQEGFAIWNGQWYAGHHIAAYSVLFPPLAWALSPWIPGVIATVVQAALFERLASARWGKRARLGALWFGAGTGVMLFTGRLPFALGVMFGLGALLALQRRRPWLAAGMAVCTALSSPVAALFLAMAGIAWWIGERDRRGADLAGAALLPTLFMAAAFPEGGYMPFDFSTFLPVPVFCAVVIAILPREERSLKVGAALYGVATTAAYLFSTPMGSNAVRLATLFGGPVLACAMRMPAGHRSRIALGLTFAALAFWQCSSPARDFLASQNEPSADAAYYDPLIEYLETQKPEDGRVEIPFTRSHFDAAEVAPHFPLARGWERQLDAERDPLFYRGILTDFTYANWLAEHAVQLVALPDVKPDTSSFRERGLIERDPPYLQLAARLDNWRVYRVTLPHPMVIPSPGASVRLARISSDELDLDVLDPGVALIRVRWSPYWLARGACVERAGDWTRLTAGQTGRVHMSMRFSPLRAIFRGRRCG